ncbi:MAG: DUF2079 domain-containing protein [Acidimicrobiia bacterium]
MRDWWLVLGMASVVAAVYSVLSLSRLWRFVAHAFDAGFVDNILWKVSRGLGDVSGLTGLHHFVDHASPLLFVAVPVYWVAPGAAYPMLLVAQSISVGLVGVAAWLIGLELGVDRQIRMALTIFVLANVAGYWAVVTELHLTSFTVGWFALSIAGAFRRWTLRWYWVLPLIVSLGRIELALGVVIAGVMLRKVSPPHARVMMRTGAVVAAVLALWMAVAPYDGSSVGGHFGYLHADGLGGLVWAMITSPVEVLRVVLNRNLFDTLLLWLIIVGVVLPIRGLKWFLIAVPMAAIPILGDHYTADFWFEHYWTPLLAALAVAVMVTASRVALDRVLLFGLAGSTLILGWAVAGPWRPLAPTPVWEYGDRVGAVATVDRLVDYQGVVSLPDELVRPLARREWVMVTPMPFACDLGQLFTFVATAGVPDVVVLHESWRSRVHPRDLARVESVLATSYTTIALYGQYEVLERRPGADPATVEQCDTVHPQDVLDSLEPYL